MRLLHMVFHLHLFVFLFSDAIALSISKLIYNDNYIRKYRKCFQSSLCLKI